MSDAGVTANGPQIIESVEMTQNGLNIPYSGEIHLFALLHCRRRVFLSRPRMGTFWTKLRHLNTSNGLAARSRHFCSTDASLRNDLAGLGSARPKTVQARAPPPPRPP